LWEIAESHLPYARLADYTQAQMDLGATLCTRHAPACGDCPLRSGCVAHAQSRTDELPTPKPGKPLPTREAILLLLLDEEGRVLLQRRPPAGVWAQLWSLPEAGNEADAAAWFERQVGGGFDAGEALEAVPHVFSHYRFVMHPRRWRGVALRTRAGEDAGLRWEPPATLGRLGIPAPVRRLLQAQAASGAMRDNGRLPGRASEQGDPA